MLILLLLNRFLFFTRLAKKCYLCHAKTGITTRRGCMPYAFKSSRFALGASKISDLPQLHGLCKHLFFGLTEEATSNEFVFLLHNF